MIKIGAQGYAVAIAVPQPGTEAFYVENGFRDDIDPPPDMASYRWEDGWWVYSPRVQAVDFDLARAQKSTAISCACKTHILAGFESSALGAAYHYPAKTTDQQNLASSVLASLLPGLPTHWTTPFWCADTSGEWAFRPHTVAQIQQVGQDAKAAILWAMAKNEQLQAAIAAATTLDDLEAITW